MNTEVKIREALPAEFETIGALMVQVFAQLDGFPKPEDDPAYYTVLANIGEQTKKPASALLVAKSGETIAGAVLFFGDIQYYGSGGTATREKNSCGFRLLAVAPDFRGKGIAKLLIHACIERTREKNARQLIIHTTKAMQTAWILYERLGFVRSADLDFFQQDLPVLGLRLRFRE